jgi:hypothetical protein
MTVKNADTADIINPDYDYTNIFDELMYGGEPIIDIAPIPKGTGGAGENDHTTMTPEQMADSQNATTDNPIINFFKGIASTVVNGLIEVGTAFQVGSKAITNVFKLAILGIAIIGALAGAYYLLGALANAKKNIKIIKGKK